MENHVLCFTTHRLSHTASRATESDIAMVTGLIDRLHNLRLQYDKHKGVLGINKRSYYLYAPKYAGGLDTRGRTPTHINQLIDMLREKANPASVSKLTSVLRATEFDRPHENG